MVTDIFPISLFPAGWDKSVVVKLLKAEYNRRSQLRPLLWDSTIELPIEQVYTRLKIVSKGKWAIQKKNDEVNVFDIFQVCDKSEDVMTIVEGSPGIGKTTFCLKLAYDWVHGKIPSECSFPKFEFVFLLKCRDIDGDIMEAISEQLLPRGMEKSVEKLLHFMKDIRNQEREILIILDGLDELPEQSRHHVDELLHRRILPFCYVLATTRQERGIEVRKSVVFDIHLEIKGYTENDSIAYVRRHFETIGQSPKGERLIEEMQQNTFLHALRGNPLNLLLLCVIYEDYEGKLPTSRTELYQVIVQCLLRRYCAKRNQPAPRNDIALQKKFEKEILALGELAWICLLSDRYGFRESELDEFEGRYPGLVARELGLLYKEESLKRLKPEHEYCFLHKTFQEYVAAAYIAEKLVNQQFNIFDHVPFNDLVTKHSQVFIFVSGMLGENATFLFTQIGEKLKTTFDWDWNKECSEESATFFIQSVSESGCAQQMAVTLCNIIPFPKVITERCSASFVEVLMAWRNFSNLQTPVELSALTDYGRALHYLESDLPVPTVKFVFGFKLLTSSEAGRLCNWCSVSRRLSEFTLDLRYQGIPKRDDRLVQIGMGLASCRTLTKLTFAFFGNVCDEGFFHALGTGLAPLTSVVLVIRSSMRYTAIRALQVFLSNKHLNSLSLRIFGDVQDLLVAAVSEALAGQTVLKSLVLHFDGPLSSSGANSLEKGLKESTSLNDLTVCVHGEPPGNWQSVVENLRLVKESPVACSIYPNSWNNVQDNHFRPVLVRKGLNLKQRLTVNVWGGMSCGWVEALFKVLTPFVITSLTLNVRGNLTSEVANSIARCLEGNKTLSFLYINIWGKLTRLGASVLSRLSKIKLSFPLNEVDLRVGSDESKNVFDISVDNFVAMRSFFTKVEKVGKGKVSLSINNNGCDTKEWTRCLGDALAENASLTSLDLTVNSCFVDADLGEDLGNSLLQSNSLTSLSLTFNCSNMKEGWECKLGDCLTKMASLTTLDLELNEYGEWNQEYRASQTTLSDVLVTIKSLSTLSVAISTSSMGSRWNKVVGECLRKCKSLKNLSLTFNIDCHVLYDFCGLDDGLAKTTSLNTLSLEIYINGFSMDYFSPVFESLNHGLSVNSSVKTLTLTLTLSDEQFESAKFTLREGLSENTSITTLNLAINEYVEGKSVIPRTLSDCKVFEGLAKNTSVTTFNLTLNSSSVVRNDWLADLSNALKKNTSLTTLRLKVNNHCASGESRLYDFSDLLGRSKSLSLLELNVSFYGNNSGCQKLLIQ